jgi:hypothetical protein
VSALTDLSNKKIGDSTGVDFGLDTLPLRVDRTVDCPPKLYCCWW